MHLWEIIPIFQVLQDSIILYRCLLRRNSIAISLLNLLLPLSIIIWLHPLDQNNVFALCGGARMKISKRMAITAEYDYLFPNQLVSPLFPPSPPRTNSLSFGWDIETGGHVFQLVFTNSQSMIESQYIGQTAGTWGKGYVYFGFNISRNFNLKTHSKPKA